MAVLELALIVLACVIGSAVLCQIVSRLSLPLVQIAVGAVPAQRIEDLLAKGCLLYTSLLRVVPRAVHRSAVVQRGPRDEPP